MRMQRGPFALSAGTVGHRAALRDLMLGVAHVPPHPQLLGLQNQLLLPELFPQLRGLQNHLPDLLLAQCERCVPYPPVDP